MSTSLKTFGAGFLGVVVVVVVWWMATGTGLVNDTILLSPPDLLARFVSLDWGEWGVNAAISLYRVLIGFAIGSALGFAVGVAIGWNDRIRDLLNLPMELLRPIPPLAWIPLAIIWFGIGDSSKVFVIALGSFFVMLTNTEKGIRTLDPAMLRQGRSYGLRGSALIRRVVVPGIMPELVVGSSIALSLAFASLVAAEMLGANSGLGYMLMTGRVDGDYGIVMVSIISIALIAYVVDLAVRRLLLPKREVSSA